MDFPLFRAVAPHGFRFGCALLIEFAPDSLWYEVSLTLTTQALRQGLGTEYHCLINAPDKIREKMAKFGLDVQRLERDDAIRIIDDYTAQVGLRKPDASRETSLRVADWSILAAQKMKSGSESDRRRVHIDDNTSILSRYNKESEIIDYWRTRLIPLSSRLEQVMLHSLVKGVHSEAFINQLESWHDGIVDVRSVEGERGLEHFIRIRMMRGEECDSKWQRLRLLENQEVTVAD
jgi:KaiC/GvpD/RAD55 family RecA-like ATPase